MKIYITFGEVTAPSGLIYLSFGYNWKNVINVDVKNRIYTSLDKKVVVNKQFKRRLSKHWEIKSWL